MILFCKCEYFDVIDDAVKRAVLDALDSRGVSYTSVDDLCRLAAVNDPVLEKWAGRDGLKIVACFPRAVKVLFSRTGLALDDSVEVYNMRQKSAGEIISGILKDAETGSKTEIQDKDKKWIPWFPVIDYDLCINCQQCRNFCLFSVYGQDSEGKIEVVNPANCKTNCPACARICPESAIIFPKYKDSPVNGDEVDPADSNEKIQVDLPGLLSGDIGELIKSRTRGRKPFESKRKSDRTGGRKDVANLQEQLNIPDDVLSSMSPREIMDLRKKAGQNCPHDKSCDNNCHGNNG